jgi:hypothetical protein
LDANRLDFDAITNALVVNFATPASLHPELTASNLNALAAINAEDFTSFA